MRRYLFKIQVEAEDVTKAIGIIDGNDIYTDAFQILDIRQLETNTSMVEHAVDFEAVPGRSQEIKEVKDDEESTDRNHGA